MPYEVPNDVIMLHEKRIELNILITACMPYSALNSVCFSHSFGSLPAQFFDQPRHSHVVLQFAIISTPLGIEYRGQLQK